MRCNGFQSTKKDLQISRSVVALRGSHGKKDAFGLGNDFRCRRCKFQSTGGSVPNDQFNQSWFVDGDLSKIQATNLFGIHVHARDVVAAIGKTGSGHQADIPRPNHYQFHGRIPENLLQIRFQLIE